MKTSTSSSIQTNTKRRTAAVYTLLYIVVAAATLGACSPEERRATIRGTVADAAGEVLYLDHLGGSRPQTVDSVRLDATGHFVFRPQAEAGPDFFSLRLGGQSVALTTDTLGTPVEVSARREGFATAYTVSDPANQRLQQAAALTAALRRDLVAAQQAFEAATLAPEAYRDTTVALVAACKQRLVEEFIYPNPSAPVAYYVLFQSVRGLSLFDPYDAADNRAYGAVATGWLYNYPQSPRIRHLERVTREGQALRQRRRLAELRADSLGSAPIATANYFDLALPDYGDRVVRLSDLVDGDEGSTVVLLDFTAYFLPASVAHNQLLNTLHTRYADRGLRIYQVCLDPDENFWKVSASRVPWTAVRDTEVLYDLQGYVQYSRPAGIYNVGNLPTTFVLTRDGSVTARVEDDARLEAEVTKHL